MGPQKKAHENTGKRRRDILDAALACFTTKGYDSTSIADICDKSGASVGSVYHHFGGKDHIAAALYMEGIRNYQEGLLASMDGADGAKAGIVSIVRFHLFWVRDNPDWARYLVQMRHEEFMKGTEDDFNGLNREFAGRIGRWIEVHVRTGAIRRLPWDLYVAILLGPCQEFARMYLAGKSVSDAESAAAGIAEAVWRALAADSQKQKGETP